MVASVSRLRNQDLNIPEQPSILSSGFLSRGLQPSFLPWESPLKGSAAATWMDLEMIILSEVSQTETNVI